MIKVNSMIILNIFLALTCSTSLGQQIKYFKRPVSKIESPYEYGLKFCKANRGHVPTIREWAQISKELFGTKGIVEYTENSSLPGPDFVLVITPKDEVGNVDKFYYSKKGFYTKNIFSLVQRPLGYDDYDFTDPYEYNMYSAWVSTGSNPKNISDYVRFDLNRGDFIFGTYMPFSTTDMVICIEDTNPA